MNRSRRLVLLTCLALVPTLLQAQEEEPRAGMVITRSVRFRPGTYRVAAPASVDSAAIVVRGDGIIVDFTDVALEGMDPSADPDRAAGVAIRIEGGRDVRVVGARIRGYKVGVLASGTRGLVLAGIDASHNWKPRLYSLVEHESLVDWLSYHHNEKDEWLRYGAAFYLRDVKGGEIRDDHAEQGMNGLLLVRSDSLRIWNNVFSYNSGLGIGLYRSSDNTIMHNHVDYDVRGYSHGYYRRGQDSAALLMFEQCMRNVVAYNSMTHGGDGLFLWAGQSTMDTGQGGANDNLFFGNDFSFAPTNGMEATFSRNRFVANRIEGSDHGLWGGYSYGSLVLGNRFSRNRIGIAIEHGQDNRVVGNRFDGDSTAISLWANPIEPSDWGYPKQHDTRSRDYRITDNLFVRHRVALRALQTTGVTVSGNAFVAVDTPLVVRDTAFRAGAATADTVAPRWLADSIARWAPRPIPGALPPESAVARRPRSSIIVDEWGPYDYRYPKLWPLDSTHAVPLRLAVLGPPGRWRLVGARGLAQLADTAGTMPDTITVNPIVRGDWDVTLEFRGAPTRSSRGEERGPGIPVRFAYGVFEPPMVWDARFITWGDATDPRTAGDAFTRLLTSATPFMTLKTGRLDYEWYRPAVRGLPYERWAMEATATVTLDSTASYALRTISDDGVRVWVDGRLAIDHWAPHESEVRDTPLLPGRHDLRVVYYQVDGWTELRLDIVRR